MQGGTMRERKGSAIHKFVLPWAFHQRIRNVAYSIAVYLVLLYFSFIFVLKLQTGSLGWFRYTVLWHTSIR